MDEYIVIIASDAQHVNVKADGVTASLDWLKFTQKKEVTAMFAVDKLIGFVKKEKGQNK